MWGPSADSDGSGCGLQLSRSIGHPDWPQGNHEGYHQQIDGFWVDVEETFAFGKYTLVGAVQFRIESKAWDAFADITYPLQYQDKQH